jgi:hypothetical protein
MNCNDFEMKVTDLARGQMMAAEVRASAVAHAAACRRCAARLDDEQRLTAGLRALATASGDQPSPARGEAQLLAAFRAAHLQPAAKQARHWPAWAAAAAILIALLAVAAIRFVEGRRPQPVAGQPSQQESAPSQQAQPPQNRPVARPEHAFVEPHHAQRAPRRDASHATSQMAHKLDGDSRPAVTPPAATQPANADTAADADEQASEIATAFIPLAGERGLAMADSLQLVRVELPRSALVSFGLPMDVERAAERVKADVLVGNDGVARAIRFVR